MCVCVCVMAFPRMVMIIMTECTEIGLQFLNFKANSIN